MAVSPGFRLLPVLLGSWLAAATLPQLFQQAKQEFKLAAYADALATLERLDAQSQQPGFERERTALVPGLLLYRGACRAALGRKQEAQEDFEEFLALKPDVTLDPAMFPKPVLAAMDGARRAIAARRTQPAETGTLAAAYRAFVLPASRPPEASQEDWSEGPVRWLLTPEDRRAYSDLADPMSRSEFISAFWRSRDPRSETPENEFRDEFEKRVAFADARFAQEETRGSLTDRGMVFILMGAPAFGGRKPLQTGDDVADASGLSRYSPAEVKAAEQPGGSNVQRAQRIEKVNGPGTKILDTNSNWIESWHYQRANLPREIPFPELVFHFVTKQGYGKNVLQRESDILSALERTKSLAKKS